MNKSYFVGLLSSLIVNGLLWGGVLYFRQNNQVNDATIIWLLIGSSIANEATTRGRLKRLEGKAGID